MGSICERISAISRIVFEIFDHICGPFIYENQNSSIGTPNFIKIGQVVFEITRGTRF